MSLNDFYETIRNLATRAIDADKNGQYETACFYFMVSKVKLCSLYMFVVKFHLVNFKEASQAIIDYKQRATEPLDANLSANLNSRLKEYVVRAEKLKAMSNSSSSSSNPVNTKSEFQVNSNLCFLYSLNINKNH